MADCRITWDTFLDYQDDKADATSVAQIQQHLADGCARCAQSLAWLERALSTLRQTPLSSAPERVQARARALFRQTRGSLLSVLATLIFDSRLNTTPVFARGERNAVVQRLFRTDDYDIDLWEERASPTESYLIGQALPRAGDETVLPEAVTLTAEDGTTLPGLADGGEFHLPAIAAGTYHLTLRLPDLEIILPDLVIGA